MTQPIKQKVLSKLKELIRETEDTETSVIHPFGDEQPLKGGGS